MEKSRYYGIKPGVKGSYLIAILDYENFKRCSKPVSLESYNVLIGFIRVRPKDIFLMHSSLEIKVKEDLKKMENVE